MLRLWRRTRPWVRVVAVVLLVGVAGTGVYWFGFRDQRAQAATPAEQTQAVAASLTTIEQSVSASGTLTPTVQQDVSFAVSGTVTSVDVAAGDTVTAGQRLATVDTLTLDAALLQAKADFASAQASLSNAQDDADGSTASDAQVAAAAAQVEVAQSAVDDAEADVAGATLVSPVAGLLTTVDLEVGDVVSGSGSSGSSSGSSGTGSATGGAMSGATGSTGSTTTASSAQFTVIGTDAWQVSVTVGESDVALLTVGDQVEMTSDSRTDTLYGTVSEIGLLSSSTGGVAAYPVVVDVTGSPEDLHDGESVDVSIIYERRTDVLTVPSAAVTTVDGRSVVTQEGADGEQTTTVVTTGATSGNLVEITDGLAEGDEVLVTTFSPRTSGSEDGSTGGTGQQGGQMPDFGSGEMPDFSQLPGGGSGFPGGGNG
ncbi:efflux RND transporter periplasmic adaptor subunit [Cellulomonas triticagri]|uniref:Biotin/lipoyl-binding protein n=1 Tax=Cellulomonas triticagri TaxID=2483352 RepID=A0A3M2J5F3_9CELL|nr:biotin/lipoyl-binding protein [Cellulomonas triticagri]RMI09332.1 biotin/lipoyl-binding protein [Cellulomonas triticagri]